jgi:hypothetical protein
MDLDLDLDAGMDLDLDADFFGDKVSQGWRTGDVRANGELDPA